jgi:hypothetical protein
VISGFRRDIDEIRALLGCYAASSGNPLPTFPDNLSVPYSRVKDKFHFRQEDIDCLLSLEQVIACLNSARIMDLNLAFCVFLCRVHAEVWRSLRTLPNIQYS